MTGKRMVKEKRKEETKKKLKKTLKKKRKKKKMMMMMGRDGLAGLLHVVLLLAFRLLLL